ncbi:flagellar hook-length control protein FliK [Devosia sp.]|uniref:flagellar hook-length control protein FliK n=1 Tax=Devosia sp. TaxID=1871048 RepID=UPI001B1A1072|nr:flagellar hook-length control protein FliK [Devosia sp.]MBO9589762.1 flagellar hook-length control protein FliK [Devosia sp.]
MASQLANLLVSAFGSAAKPVQPPVKSNNDDQFARLLDAPAAPAKRNDAQAAQSSDNKPATPDAAPKDAAETTETAAAAPAETETEDDSTEDTGTTSLADTLLAALAALGLTTEGATDGEAGEGDLVDAAALSDIKDAIGELSQLLGMDVKTLMQQLAALAKGVAAEGGGEAELAAKLNGWLGERLGAAGLTLDANAEASLAKLMDGLGEFAKAIPAEPELASAQLKMPEPVLAPKTAAPEPKVEVSEPELKVEPQSLERKADAKPAEPENKGQNTQAHTARPNGGQDNNLNLTPTAPAAAQADAPQQVDAATTPRVVQTGYQTSQQQLNLPQIAFELSRQVGDGNTRFQIRLDPAELGRIDVKLDIDKSGQVHARLTVEKAETLDLMQRDQRALEKALQQAGLDQSKTNLEFSLKQNPFAGDQNQRSGEERSGSGSGQDSQEETEVSAPAITLYRGALQASGLNILA